MYEKYLICYCVSTVPMTFFIMWPHIVHPRSDSIEMAEEFRMLKSMIF